MTPRDLGDQLRHADGPFLARRRAVAGLALAAVGAMMPIAAYQLGLIEHMPDVPWPPFDAGKIAASDQAYAILGIPDGSLAISSYATTLALAAMGPADRAMSAPWIPLALAAKAAFDAAASAKLTADEWTKHRALCLWCLIGSAATFAYAPLVIPEARAALRALLSASGRRR